MWYLAQLANHGRQIFNLREHDLKVMRLYLFGLFLKAAGPDGPGRVNELHVDDEPPVEVVELAVALLAAVHSIVLVDQLQGVNPNMIMAKCAMQY